MRAFNDYREKPMEFWAVVKFVSEMLGYTDRKSGDVRTYDVEDIERLFVKNGIPLDYYLINEISTYSAARAMALNNSVRSNLMSHETACCLYEDLVQTNSDKELLCKIPMNKQSGEMKKINYFTAIINIITELTIRNSSSYHGSLGFDSDPRGLVYMFDDKHRIIGASSRRFDGAYPSILNPRIVWEIKEYYYATTFGSRVADGVYETQLDGHEFIEIMNRTNYKVTHVFFVDGYRTWWVQGKSYLCRIIDMLNAGLVDEVIFGKEVLKRWPVVLKSNIV